MFNFWLMKAKERNILKVVEFAHRNQISVEDLTKEQIIQGLTLYLRDALYA